MVAPRVKDSAEVRSPGDDEVELVPVAGPWVSPGDFVPVLTREVGVGDAEAVMAAEFEQSLSVLVQPAYAMVAEAGGPCLPVGPNACVEVAQQVYAFRFRDARQHVLQGLVKLVLRFRGGGERRSVGRDDVYVAH